MSQFQILRWFTTALAVILIGVAGAIVEIFFGTFAGIMSFGSILALFFMQAMENIPSNPPERGIPRFLGNYIAVDEGGISLKPGWTFLPFRGILFDVVLYNASQINLTLQITERTPDNGTVVLDPFFTYQVDERNPVGFILAGDRSGVEEKFSERVAGRVREWIVSPYEGPLTWPEALKSNGLAVDVIIQKLFPGKLPEIDPTILAAIPGGIDISVPVYIKYFTGRPPLSEDNPQEAGVKTLLDNLKISDRATWVALQNAIRTRIAFTEKAKGGECSFRISNLGIIVTLVGLGKIAADGATAKAADQVASAQQAAHVQDIEAENYRKEIAEMILIHNGNEKEATEAVNLRRKLQTKSSVETQFALRGDNITALQAFLGPVGAAFAAWISSKRSTDQNPPTTNERNS